MEIRVLARQGMSIRAIAQQLRVSRNTVRKYLRNPGLPIYPSRAARPTKLDPFKPYLQARIQAAKPHWIPATVLLRELREHGYTGGLSQLKAWLSPLRHDASGTWLITSCRSANNIMPITFFLPAFIASSFYSA